MVDKKILDLKNKKNIHVVGAAGIEGSAIALFLAQIGHKKVILHDFSNQRDFEKAFKSSRDYLKSKEADKAYQDLINTGYKINYKDTYLKGIEKADLIFVSQGWFRYESNQKLKEIEGKIPFSSATELYFGLSPCPIIGVTGTVGKSTTARLIYEMLKLAGKSVILSGNDRDNPPVLDKILNLDKDSYLVLEISNRQLIGLKYSPQIAVITNIFPNHPDDHKDFADYVSVKSNILRYQNPDDFAVLNFDNKTTRGLRRITAGEFYYYSLKKKIKRGAYLDDKSIIFQSKDFKSKILDLKSIKLPGKHNLSNIMAAIIVGEVLGLQEKNIQKAIYSFQGVKHRLEFVREYNGVSYFEDSQSTSPYSTVAAIEAFSHQLSASGSRKLEAGGRKLILIMGGYRANVRRSDYAETVSHFFEPQVKAVFLIGKVGPLILEEYKKQRKVNDGGPEEVKYCEFLPKAMVEAKKLAQKGDNIVLSPGAESFGEFRDYRERGEKFKELIMQF